MRLVLVILCPHQGMNKAVVVFLREVSLVQHLVELVYPLEMLFFRFCRLSSPSKKVILSNVPPFIPMIHSSGC